MKLLRIERGVGEYDQVNYTEKIREVPLNIAIEELVKIVPPRENDPLLYDPYDLDAAQLLALKEYLSEEVMMRPGRDYVLECTGIYDWSANG